jgi:hypothetical protein
MISSESFQVGWEAIGVELRVELGSELGSELEFELETEVGDGNEVGVCWF